MDAKNPFLLPAVALTLGAGAALTLCSATQAAPPATTAPATAPTNAEITVKLTTPAGPKNPIALPFVLFQSPPSPPKPKPPLSPAQAEQAKKDAETQRAGMEALLKTIVPASVTVTVTPNPLTAGHYVAVLKPVDPRGTMDAQSIADTLAKAQAAAGTTVFVVSSIPVKKPDTPDTSDPVTLTYTLRFLRGPLPASDGTTAGTPEVDPFGEDKSAMDAAAFLNTIYPTGDGAVSVTAHENHLILTGDPNHVNTLRQMLALTLDVPSPQVRADVYTIQVNTTPHNRDAAQDKIEEIQAGIQIVRDLIHGSEGVLGAYLASDRAKVDPTDPPQDGVSPTPRQKLFASMRRAGYEPSPHRPLSLVDMLILLVVSDRDRFRKDLIPAKQQEDQELSNQKTDEQRWKDPKIPYLVDKLERELYTVRLQVESGDVPLKSALYSANDAKAYSRHGSDLKKLLDRIETKVRLARNNHNPIFGRLAGVYSTPADSDIEGMTKFLDAWHACKGAFLKAAPPADHPEVNLREYPDQLSSKSAVADLLLKEAMDALTGDLQEVYFQPLLDWIRDDVRGTHAGDTGIDLVGTTSITVRDRTLVQTQGTADSYFKFTSIPHLTLNDLTGAKALAAGTPPTPDTTTETVATDKAGVVRDHNNDPVLLTPGEQLALDPTTGLALRKGNIPTGDPVIRTVPNTAQTKTPAALASTVFGALTPLQALALQAALNEDAVVPTYRKIAPGTSLALRPFVLPDGGSARIQMSLTSTVDADAPDTTKRDVPFDVVAKQTVTTEATISAFDLETVGTFDVQTTALGDYAWRIPVLDQIPLLGDVFHGPRRRETKRQDSIALVNLTILPRSLDLVPYYVDAAAIKKAVKDRTDADKAVGTRGAGQ